MNKQRVKELRRLRNQAFTEVLHWDAQFDLAKDAYEEGFRAWQTVCETSPEMRSDPLLVAEMKEHLERYHEVLATLQAPVNNPAVLQGVIGGLEPITL